MQRGLGSMEGRLVSWKMQAWKEKRGMVEGYEHGEMREVDEGEMEAWKEGEGFWETKIGSRLAAPRTECCCHFIDGERCIYLMSIFLTQKQ